MAKLEKSMEILNSIDLMSFRAPEGEFGFSAEKFFEDASSLQVRQSIINVAQKRNVEVNKNESLNNVVSQLVNSVLEKSSDYDQNDLKQSNFDLLEGVASDIRANYAILKNKKEVKGTFTEGLKESRADRDNFGRNHG